ncbi:hypothetical protein J7J69_00240 [candidate division WOR-3 bacterium]|nr:hypothetical protein [candidate division WOR-3 bacterium]
MGLETGFKEMVKNIAESVPGFNGYYRRETRREEERMLRDFIASRISESINRINETVREITKSGDISVLDIYGRVQKNLEKLKDKIRYGNYGYSGFFDLKQVDEKTLENVLKKDLEILKMVADLDEMAEQGEIKEIEKAIKEIEMLFNERKDIIENIK